MEPSDSSAYGVPELPATLVRVLPLSSYPLTEAGGAALVRARATTYGFSGWTHATTLESSHIH